MKKNLWKRITVGILTLSLALTSLVGCGDKGNKTSITQQTMNVCIGAEPSTLDPALNVAGDVSIMLIHTFSGLVRYDENGELVPDCLEEIPDGVNNSDGTVTYTYKLKSGLKWSDGVSVKPSDFEYAWRRAVDSSTGSGNEYLFSYIKGYSDNNLDIVSDDAANTLTVTLNNACSYWNQLLAFSAFMPVRKDVIEKYGDSWATNPESYVTNGPYKLTAWDHDSKITLDKNTEYWNSSNMTMNELNFYLSTDDSNTYANFKNGTYAMIDSVPTDEIPSLLKDSQEFYIAPKLGTYYLFFNEDLNLLPNFSGSANEKELAQQDIRKALGKLLDRNYIVNSITKAGQVAADSLISNGIKDKDGTVFSKDGYWSNTSDAYDTNVKEAIETLKKYYNYDSKQNKFTNIPSLTFSFNTSTENSAIGEYIQYCFEKYGITVELQNSETAVYMASLPKGDTMFGRYGWATPYNDPIGFLDIWNTNGKNNVAHIGSSNASVYNIDLSKLGYGVLSGTWDQTYDKLISIIKSESDMDKYYQLCHIAQDVVMSTGEICPIYYYSDPYMLSKNYTGLLINPDGLKFFGYCKAVQ